MSFKSQHPMDIVHRVLAMEVIRELGAEVVKDLNPNLIKSYIEEDEEGNETEVLELDFEYMLFDAPIYQIELALKKLEEDDPEKISSFVGLDGKHLKYNSKTNKEKKHEIRNK
jgi:hypothetical protein